MDLLNDFKSKGSENLMRLNKVSNSGDNIENNHTEYNNDSVIELKKYNSQNDYSYNKNSNKNDNTKYDNDKNIYINFKMNFENPYALNQKGMITGNNLNNQKSKIKSYNTNKKDFIFYETKNNNLLYEETKKVNKNGILKMNDIYFENRRDIRNTKNFLKRTNTINPKNIIESWFRNNSGKLSKINYFDISQTYENDHGVLSKNRLKSQNIPITSEKKLNMNDYVSPSKTDISNNLNNYMKFSSSNLNNKKKIKDVKKYNGNLKMDTKNLKTSSTKNNTNPNDAISFYLTNSNFKNNIISNNFNEKKTVIRNRKIASARSDNLKRLMDISPHSNIPKSVKYSWVNLPGMKEKFFPKIPRSLKDNEGNRFKHISHGSSTIFLKQEHLKKDFLLQLLINREDLFSSSFIKVIKIKNIRRLITLKRSKFKVF